MNAHHPGSRHDAFFSWLTSNLSYARQLLACILPALLLEELDLSTLRIVPPDQTDGRLRRHRSDVLFEVSLRSGKPMLIYLLLEHKSYHDAHVTFQVLRYIVHLAEDWLRQNQPLHCILPVVVYNGSEPWTAAPSLHEIFDVPQKCAALFPQFRVSVLDLPRMDDNILRGTVDFLACARMLRSVLQPDLPTRLRDIFLGLESRLVEAGNGHESPDSPLLTILSYASSQIDRSELEQIIDQTFEDNPMIKAQLMKSAADVWFEEGRLKGLEQGMERGMERGRSEGLELGFLMAEIQFLQRQLKQPVSSKSQLEQLPFEDLTALAGRLRPLAEQN